MFILEILLQWIRLTVRSNRNYDQAPRTNLLICLLILVMDGSRIKNIYIFVLKVIGHPGSANPNFRRHLYPIV